jgi:hypothetical protein
VQQKQWKMPLYLGMLGALIACLLLLAACGGGSSTASVSSSTARQDPNHVSLAQLMGSPTAKITSGANFEVTGRVRNLDKAQHDIHLEAILKNVSGQVVGTAKGLADNVPAGETDIYTLQGTLTQPTWSTVSIVITKVTENVDGQGSD